MKTSTLRLGLMLGIAAFWQMSPVQAKEQLLERPIDDVSTVFNDKDTAETTPIFKIGLLSNAFQSATDCCPGTGGGGGNWFRRGGCDDECKPTISGCADDCCDKYGVVGTFGSNAFKGFSDFSGQSNFGMVAGVNVGIPIGLQRLEEYGIGIQAGASYGVYDFMGRSYSVTENSASQEQMFFTLGAYHRAQECQHLSYGLVYDWMANDNWGIFSNEPFMGQWRGQIEYIIDDSNAVGLQGALRDRGDSQVLGPAYGGATAHYSPISYVNAFYHHTFQSGADYHIYAGIPDGGRPAGNVPGGGSLGQFIVGTSWNVPVTDRLGVYTTATYMRPTAGPGALGSTEETWNLGLGMAWYPGRNSCSPTVAGRCNMPYLPLANNGNFLVDMGVNPAVTPVASPPTH
ncbi:MAG: DUF6666 family protein [Planctomycetales bacterium]